MYTRTRTVSTAGPTSEMYHHPSPQLVLPRPTTPHHPYVPMYAPPSEFWRPFRHVSSRCIYIKPDIDAS
ncbi:hypothetical protein AB1N83_006385 [Pleurotus pulmonarius]